MKIQNMKLFTEYERQFKRKYPGMQCELIPKEDRLIFRFNYVYEGKAYPFAMKAPNEAKNGDVECKVIYVNDLNYKIEFDESRKPMEMNIDNLINAVKYILNKMENKNG